MKYTFDVFLEQLDGNWYEHDPLLQHLISRYPVQPPESRPGCLD